VIDASIVGHATGWNRVMMSALRHKYPDVVKAVEEEEARWKQSYFDGEKAGRQDALNDLHAGRLAIEVTDPPENDIDFERTLRERYQIGLRRVQSRAEEKMMNNRLGHAAGYNEVRRQRN